ncbi:MaoC/PaaZ C-terminal domain-containing protein [Caulobacter sp. KR2-114]|uniref:MaoC/PaaZ C-terminal domain-containing protein n=1 Tax=Caulobacter sp. KR2-114 TaxID=3400912 RepID=UPI003BFDFF1E
MPEHVCGPIDRTTLALFAGASHDHVRLHIDSDFAKAAGMDDVFAHGMLVMAYLGQFLTRWRPQSSLRRWSVRFVAITPLHATVHCRGHIVEILEQGDERLARVKLGAWTDNDLQTVDGEALVALG